MKNKDNEAENVIESTGTQEIINDLESFEFVYKVNVISVPKSEKQIWPKIEIIIANDYSLENKVYGQVGQILTKYEFPKANVSFQQKGITYPFPV
jgi:hypothetical protein